VLVTVSFGTRNTAASVYYTLLLPDKSVHQARTNTGVTEISAGTGLYGVDLAESLVSGKTILWDINGTSKSATETFVDDSTIIDTIHSELEHLHIDLATVDVNVNEEAIATAITSMIFANMGQIEYLEPGPGIGSVEHTDIISGRGGTPIVDAIVRAYIVSGGSTDWDNCSGHDRTDHDGEYTLWLDPGTYSRRIWKNGQVVLDDEIIITAP
jgi:hypothetical protein